MRVAVLPSSAHFKSSARLLHQVPCVLGSPAHPSVCLSGAQASSPGLSEHSPETSWPGPCCGPHDWNGLLLLTVTGPPPFLRFPGASRAVLHLQGSHTAEHSLSRRPHELEFFSFSMFFLSFLHSALNSLIFNLFGF